MWFDTEKKKPVKKPKSVTITILMYLDINLLKNNCIYLEMSPVVAPDPHKKQSSSPFSCSHGQPLAAHCWYC